MSSREFREPYTVTIDYEQLIWEGLRFANAAFQSPVYSSQEQHTKFGGTAQSGSRVSLERYEDEVLKVYGYIRAIPEWIEEDNLLWPNRLSKWAAERQRWEDSHKVFVEQHASWKTSGKGVDWEPLEFPEPKRPKPFALEVADCWTKETGWQPFHLHTAILGLLHRRGFFKRKSEIETIEGVAEQAEEVTGSPTT